MTRSRLVLRSALCGILGLLFAATWTSSASAWTWVRATTVYDGPGLCVQGDAGIDHFIPGVFSGNLAYANTYALSEGCGTGLTKPDGWAAVRLEVLKLNGSVWEVCRSTDWTYGATGVSGGDVGGPWGPTQTLDYGGSVCGPGTYGTMAHAYIWDGSAWRGGGVWSGGEFVP